MNDRRDLGLHDILLDGRKIGNLGQLHTVLKEALELPDYYGNNLDALWDCLTGYVAMPLTIRWVHFQESEKKLGDHSRLLLQLFRDAEEELEGFQLLLE
ncbi:barnase inhibitor [Paenibacillus larvae subsp. pulvifaciens]|uniref:Ribonuclease inhibitor-like protein n=2 Tax=Paenibacillus larvae TaxID=1464 RepID=V9W7L8_9BACL|nr:ribonuclease inhibitor-like protein [Paenibacillus larvae subsp. larvae DSM 25430]AQR76827.1 barnase inhibitor [Paenibacillus larvae subsp. larvae]AQT83431.1 barnase inhibitor [Paenibacillus larvae subsp. pulvifaciens]MBH0342206.1 barnase inhibitor [Paenibacillus larvae]AQZ48533.1 barnase inhibitor [Paenibacillus larvae subsp. pulvifaciens]